MKKPIILSLALLILLTLGTLNTAYGLLSVSSPDQTFGFQNGNYVGFASPMTFATSVDGGGTQQIASSNASFGNWMFFQQQGSDAVYGFFVSGCNVTVTNYFVGENSNLQFTTDGSGIVKVYVGILGLPTIVSSGTSGSFDNTLNVAVLTVVGAVPVRLDFVGGTGNGGGGDSNPTPTPFGVTPTPKPLGTNDFQIDNLNLGTVQPNSTVTANLHFRFSGSSYTLQSISFQAPFDSWYFPNGNFSSYTYMLNTNGDSSGDVSLWFAVRNVASQSYSVSFSVVAIDAFGVTHTSSGTINAKVSTSTVFDVKAFFMLHPLYLILVAVLVIVMLVALVLFSKRRR